MHSDKTVSADNKNEKSVSKQKKGWFRRVIQSGPFTALIAIAIIIGVFRILVIPVDSLDFRGYASHEHAFSSGDVLGAYPFQSQANTTLDFHYHFLKESNITSIQFRDVDIIRISTGESILERKIKSPYLEVGKYKGYPFTYRGKPLSRSRWTLYAYDDKDYEKLGDYVPELKKIDDYFEDYLIVGRVGLNREGSTIFEEDFAFYLFRECKSSSVTLLDELTEGIRDILQIYRFPPMESTLLTSDDQDYVIIQEGHAPGNMWYGSLVVEHEKLRFHEETDRRLREQVFQERNRGSSSEETKLSETLYREVNTCLE